MTGLQTLNINFYLKFYTVFRPQLIISAKFCDIVILMFTIKQFKIKK